MADYKTLRGTATFEYEEKRSRFIATAAFADTEEKALAVSLENGAKAALTLMTQGVSEAANKFNGSHP